MDWQQRLKLLVVDDIKRGKIKLKLLQETTEFRTALFDDNDDAVLAGLLDIIEPPAAAAREGSAKRLKSSEDASGRSGSCLETWKVMCFDLGECDLSKWVAGSLMHTESINEVMENFGGFPARYYVRHEEIMVSEIIRKKLQDSRGKKRPEDYRKFVIVGSPGVGKSVFMVLLAFYFARCLSQSVLLLRKSKTNGGYKCVFLSQGWYSEIEVRKLKDIIRIRKQVLREYPVVWYFMDGFRHANVEKDHAELSPYHLLATSSQFRLKSDDPTELVVLPAWQFSDLADFANKTEMFAGERKISERAKELFYFSGGSLREFCRPKEDLEYRVAHNLS